MIFITLGSQKFQFNRLLEEVDDLVESNIMREDIFAQTGYSDYEPKNYEFTKFLDYEKYNEREKKADVVLTHGGTGAIIGAVKNKKRVIAVPRLACYGEHVDNHQIQLLKEFEEMGIILACYDIKKLGDAYNQIYSAELKPYTSKRMSVLSSIEAFLIKTEKK
ncbi:UDP-N-acetylglucosamine transferase subunit ALG13 [Lachnospiraceae bacterium PF1-21]|uniref:Beta(1,3)galactosyltransferase EpsH n=1 Tax=Ohessyouella blattaphilus TaxID=2949333 RepID=A0ABT1ELC0_9FIRM|nr:PssE/Cps14G family polysaccharide biosynthesis glycosyltransferase [Ohessyouella blattaphilus]MCP1111498.1 beta(1,3)galactosyltransferase EpsH [Ohessyouella blattaphilus]MCR8564892.1 beta(1,3)galactosyltransferase EpsH [Ohessyouella blattaphilus]